MFRYGWSMSWPVVYIDIHCGMGLMWDIYCLMIHNGWANIIVSYKTNIMKVLIICFYTCLIDEKIAHKHTQNAVNLFLLHFHISYINFGLRKLCEREIRHICVIFRIDDINANRRTFCVHIESSRADIPIVVITYWLFSLFYSFFCFIFSVLSLRFYNLF